MFVQVMCVRITSPNDSHSWVNSHGWSAESWGMASRMPRQDEDAERRRHGPDGHVGERRGEQADRREAEQRHRHEHRGDA